jgi:ubiquinone/menaquinone biosynthesis C-methylase UbiE
MNSEFDLDKSKLNQRQSWGSMVCGWQKWWKIFDNDPQKVSRRLIELAGIRPGERVLDIAKGIDEPAISIAKIVGKDGHVTAADISTQMLALAEVRARSRSLGLQNIIDFKE